MTIIQSINLPLWLSVDGVTYKQLVCMENYTFAATSDTEETTTYCGIATGVGPQKFTINFSAVAEAAKVSGTQMTWDDIFAAHQDITLLYFKIQYPSPGSSSNNIFLAGNAYVTSSSLIGAVNTAVKFSGTLTGTGTVDRTP